MGTKTIFPVKLVLFSAMMWKKDPQTWGRKRSTFPVKDADFSCEKRIPKHGDENNPIELKFAIVKGKVKKGSPNMGTKTVAIMCHLSSPILRGWKKDPQTWGRKPPFRRLITIKTSKSEKRIPKHGDENLKRGSLIISWDMWKKDPQTWGRKREHLPQLDCPFYGEKRIPKHGDENNTCETPLPA